MPVKTYIRRPVTSQYVHAIQYDGTNIAEIEKWMNQKHVKEGKTIFLKFACGEMPISIGQWVVKTEKSDDVSYFTLFKNDAFRSMYY